MITQRGKTLLVAFSLGFVLYLLCVLPIIIHHGGMFFYYGDYNVQQVPFYMLAHRAVRNGGFFWNWKLDLGGSMIGDFAFYLWGSPFFWLTIPFPEASIPYLLPFLMALKFGVAAMTAVLYMRRYVRGRIAVLIGALLYAFSGFQACNIVFQHFSDVVAFFPLLMLTFDDLMALDHQRGDTPYVPAGKRLVRFALAVALMAIVNYYFFFGQVLFLLLYFCVRYTQGNSPRIAARMFVRALAGGLLGVFLASFFLVQAFVGVTGNSRIQDILTGYNILVYESMKLPYAIVKSFVMIPDIIGKGTLFYTDGIRNASLAGFLPLFGLSGVAAFFFAHRRQIDWRKSLLIVCAVIAFVPFLNAAFSLFNSQYYARWFYMPLFFMAMITAQQVERGKYTDWKLGSLLAILLFLFMLTVALLPSKNADGEIVYLNMTDNPDLFWRQVKGTGVMFVTLILIIHFVKGKMLRKLAFLTATAISCFISTYVVLANGASLINDFGMTEWKKQMLDTRPELPEGFYRVETDSTSTNYEMVWDVPTIHCFLSTVPSEIFDFYEQTAGLTRGVESDPPLSRTGLRAILSTRYYLENAVINTDGEFGQGRGIEGYAYDGEQNDFTIYENRNYIPMGFTFRYYVRESDFEKADKADADSMLVKALILSDEDAETYGEWMKEIPVNEIGQTLSSEDFVLNCMERRDSACTAFETDTRGFTATTADLLSDSLVFFSVPATEGFRATMDGEAVPIVKADYGLMAIPTPAGVHEIRVTYHPEGAVAGWLLTILGAALSALYLFWFCRRYSEVIREAGVRGESASHGQDEIREKERGGESHERDDHESEDSGEARGT